VPHVLFGSGGTFTSLAGMVMVAKGHLGVSLRGYQMNRADVRQFVDQTRRLPVKERGKIPGAESRRADIIVAGLAVVDRLMHYFGVDLLQVHNRGVRDGLIFKLIEEQQAPLDTAGNNRPNAD
jgi:exopolyphosphatase / guanosine-5'-triphosphate,3'-diphosphate pyrophosphatase